MSDRRLKHRFSALVFLAISLVSLRSSRAIPFRVRNKFIWIYTITMAFMLRQIFQSPSPRLISDHSKVGKKVEGPKDVDYDEYDFVIVGGGMFVTFSS